MSLIQKSVLNMVGTITVNCLAAIAGIILARSLGPDGMGQYQLCITTVIMIATLFNFGVGQASIYFINNRKEPVEMVSSTSLVFGFAIGVFSAILLFGVLQIRSYFGVLPVKTIAFLSFGVWVLSCYTSVLTILMAGLRVKLYITVVILRSFIALAMLVQLVLLSAVTVSSALAVQVLGIVGSFILLVWFLRNYLKRLRQTSLSLIKRMIGFGLQFTVGNVINLLNVNIGLYLVRYYLSENFEYVGYYGRATAVAGLLIMLPTAVGPILYSRWSSLSLEQRVKQVGMATRLMVALGLTICVILMFAAKWIILLMYGSEYTPAVFPLRILSLALLLTFICYPLHQLFPSSGHPLLSSVVLGVSLIGMAGMMVVLIPRYSIAGAAIAVGIGNALGALVGYAIAVRKFGVDIGSCFIVRSSDIKYVLQSFMPQ